MMSLKNRLMTGLTVLILLPVNYISGQVIEEVYLQNLEQIKQKENHRSEDIVINVKMIERFYNTYNEVEVISWKEIALNENFEDVKNHLSAYNNLELTDAESIDLKQVLRLKANEIKEIKSEETEGNPSLAIIEDDLSY